MAYNGYYQPLKTERFIMKRGETHHVEGRFRRDHLNILVWARINMYGSLQISESEWKKFIYWINLRWRKAHRFGMHHSSTQTGRADRIIISEGNDQWITAILINGLLRFEVRSGSKWYGRKDDLWITVDEWKNIEKWTNTLWEKDHPLFRNLLSNTGDVLKNIYGTVNRLAKPLSLTK